MAKSRIVNVRSSSHVKPKIPDFSLKDKAYSTTLKFL